MKTSTTARDYLVGTVLVAVAFALAFAVARFTMTGEASDVPPEATPTGEALGVRPAPAPVSGAGRPAEAWLASDLATRRRQLTGRFDPATDPAFVVLAKAYTDGEQDYRVRRETAEALTRMIDSAARDGVTLRVVSATRNFDRQAAIWGAKWRGERTLSNGVNLGERTDLSDSAKARMILLYSSMPGTSRHHWGTDVDLNALNSDYFRSGRGLREYEWLTGHAAHFGFYQPYTSKAAGRTGYEEEEWHWSYRPLSRNLLRAYRDALTDAEVGGFDGARAAPRVRAVEEYVAGVAPELL